MSEIQRAVGNADAKLEPSCIYDAGDAGCGDGVPMEFRRRIQSVEVGQLVEVLMRDPSAKEDLPSLIRMMGHRIRSADELDDGRLKLLVERSR
jgi:TusA-related sulfurtransferase